MAKLPPENIYSPSLETNKFVKRYQTDKNDNIELSYKITSGLN
jgi:hypothetical protein